MDLDKLPNLVDKREEKQKLKLRINRTKKRKKTITKVKKLDQKLTKLQMSKTSLAMDEADAQKEQKVKWSVQQKMYAMTENFFGVALFLIFRLFKTYGSTFWAAIMLHSLTKILYSMRRIFKNKSIYTQIVNGLVVGGEACRYMLYLVMLIWTGESETNKILEDQKYGSGMVWLLFAELLFHLAGFILTIVVDCKTKYVKYR